MKPLTKAALHTHTTFSDGMVNPTELVKAASENNISVLAITDHDTMKGLGEAKVAGKKYGVEIIPGEEVTAGSIFKQKHILALNISKPIPHSLSVEETIDAIHKQGGLAIISHVEGTNASVSLDELKALLQTHKIDALEGINGKFDKRRELKKFHLLMIGVSDSHYGTKDILSAYTEFPGKTAQDLLRAIKNGTAQAIPGKSDPIPKNQQIRQHFRSWILVGAKRYLLGSL